MVIPAKFLRVLKRQAKTSWRTSRTMPNLWIRKKRLAHLVWIDKPLLFVSELQRSGGTLLSRLLDNHPQLYVHPHELSIGRPDKSHWPQLDLRASPQIWFNRLRESPGLLHAMTGLYSKGQNQRMPFMFSQGFQRAIFLGLVAERNPANQRQILDCYITSYFNAWIDYQGLYRDPSLVKYWSVFAARLAVNPEQCARFFTDYPEGYLISIIRDPHSWFASARRHGSRKYDDMPAAVELWRESTLAYLQNISRHPGRIILLDFRDLITKTTVTMQKVCQLTGLDFHESMTSPTFNGIPVVANSSFKIGGAGKIHTEVIGRGAELSKDEEAYIEKQAGETYRSALTQTVTIS